MYFSSFTDESDKKKTEIWRRVVFQCIQRGIPTIINELLQAKITSLKAYSTHMSEKSCLYSELFYFTLFPSPEAAVSLQPCVNLHTYFQHCECACLECMFAYVFVCPQACVSLRYSMCLCAIWPHEPQHLTWGQ